MGFQFANTIQVSHPKPYSQQFDGFSNDSDYCPVYAKWKQLIIELK